VPFCYLGSCWQAARAGRQRTSASPLRRPFQTHAAVLLRIVNRVDHLIAVGDRLGHSQAPRQVILKPYCQIDIRIFKVRPASPLKACRVRCGAVNLKAARNTALARSERCVLSRMQGGGQRGGALRSDRPNLFDDRANAALVRLVRGVRHFNGHGGGSASVLAQADRAGAQSNI